jgi:hypothetical protein
MSETVHREKDLLSDVRVVVEVDGRPVGFLNLDVDRLWPTIRHRGGSVPPAEWIDPKRYDSALRAVVVKRLMQRLQTRLYPTLGEEIVKAELDVEAIALRAEAAAQAFGRTRAELDKVLAEPGGTPAEFDVFFWDYFLGERESDDLKKDWKSSKRGS